jgi:hypothetical protein
MSLSNLQEDPNNKNPIQLQTLNCFLFYFKGMG